MTFSTLKRLIPRAWKRHARQAWAEVRHIGHPNWGANDILSRLYAPTRCLRLPSGKRVWCRPSVAGPVASDGFPLPPTELRMGHDEDGEAYLAAGREDADWIRSILAREGVNLSPTDAMLDWGCATGRVLRYFAAEARSGAVWGCDASGPCLDWCKAALSPPFRFVTATAFPHLPFEDNTFQLVYGNSVITHIHGLLDTWLMELRRITRPGGLVLLTIHDENTCAILAADADLRRTWTVNQWWSEVNMSGGLNHDVEIEERGGTWSQVTTFFRQDWICSDWGQYFDVVSIDPPAHSYQSMVVLRKPSRE